MHGFSTIDGFMEINECLAEMIKYLANEPSVGLFYVQQHTQNAVPNVISLKNNIVQRSHETNFHTEDLEDSICMVRSMKECGFPIAEDMIKDIKKSLAIMSTKEPKRGLIHNPNSRFQMGRTSWGPATWGRATVDAEPDGERSGYFSNVLKSAKQKANKFKWSQLDSKDSRVAASNHPLSIPLGSSGSCRSENEADELPLSNQVPEELQEVVPVDDNGSLPSQNLLLTSEDYDDFRANREVKLNEWLERTGIIDKRHGSN